MTDPLTELSAQGVSIWLDDLSRERLRTGNLADLVAHKHVVGVTTNPTIFQKALSNGGVYADQVADLARRKVSVDEAIRALTAADVRAACDVLRRGLRQHRRCRRPRLHRGRPTARPRHRDDHRRGACLWWLVDRPNLFIKIPATIEGLPAIAAVLGEGISVNVTLIFGLERYGAVMDAFLEGVEQAIAGGLDVSRIWPRWPRSSSAGSTPRSMPAWTRSAPRRRRPCVARRRSPTPGSAYEAYEKVFSSDRWKALAAAGAKPQRPLWASTGVKDPAYDDTRYVIDLVAPGTVNTMPEATLNAVADHGVVRGNAVAGTYDEARADDRRAGGARRRLPRRHRAAGGGRRRQVRGLLG